MHPRHIEVNSLIVIRCRETISVDLYAGFRLWRGAEAHVDGLMRQGFGLSQTLGVDGFPNGEAFRLGTDIPNVNLSRVFIRQTIGLGGVFNGISDIHQRFFAAGGTGILAGEGALTYGVEKILETCYDFQIWKGIHGALDYQFVVNPAFNRDRGPVSILGARLHAEF